MTRFVPFLQKINNKFEWLPKNGTHYDIINEHRTKLLIKLKEFFLNNNLLNSEKTHFDAFSKINEDEIASNKGIAERTTAFFTKEILNNINVKIEYNSSFDEGTTLVVSPCLLREVSEEEENTLKQQCQQQNSRKLPI